MSSQMTVKKCLCHGAFWSFAKSDRWSRILAACERSARRSQQRFRRVTTRTRVTIANCLLGDSEFFFCCGSNRSAMHVDSDVHRSDVATHSLLGGQYGEESEESESEEEEDQEEEVLNLLRSTTRSTVMSTQRRKGRRGRNPNSATLLRWPRRP